MVAIAPNKEASQQAALEPNPEFGHLASDEQIARTVQALEANGIQTFVVETGDEARQLVLDLIPDGAEVYNSMSRTLETIGLAREIEASERFQPIRPQVLALDRNTQGREIRKLRSSHDVLVGSVHAITEQGEILIASGSGSQLAPAAAGAGKVIWVVGSQKLVRTLDDGLRRIKEYSFPLEDARMRQINGMGSGLYKILIINREVPDRITVVLVKENLGF